MLIACETVFTNGRGASYHSVNHQMDDRLSLSNGRCILYRYTAAASTTNGKHSEDNAPQARKKIGVILWLLPAILLDSAYQITSYHVCFALKSKIFFEKTRFSLNLRLFGLNLRFPETPPHPRGGGLVFWPTVKNQDF